MIILKGIGSSPYIVVGQVKILYSYDLSDIKGNCCCISIISHDMLSHLHNVTDIVTDYEE